MRSMFQQTSFSSAVALIITTNQSIGSIEELKLQIDDDNDTLCKSIRRSGEGEIANPNTGVAGMPSNIPNHGLKISQSAKNNAKLAVYYYKHAVRTSRILPPVDITLAHARELRFLRDVPSTHKDPKEANAPKINDKEWPKTIEVMKDFLFHHYDVNAPSAPPRIIRHLYRL